MNRLTIVTVILLSLLLTLGCSGGAGGAGGMGGTPVSPANPAKVTSEIPGSINTELWGYWDVYIDIPAKKVEAVLNRQAMFTANVVKFVNGKPPKLGFKINETPAGVDYVDVDIDVSITHPFPGLTEYNGYDIRGVFMGDGSASLQYNPALNYPVIGTDQNMLPDPDDGFGGADGYTRWFNKAEFSTGGMPLFQYTQGSVASPGFDGNATLCPYKYFADGLGVNDDLFSWLSANPEAHGVFSAGQTNTRNYYLRFPNSKGVKYGYAVLAGWEGTEPEYHPANVPEAVALNVTDNSTVYYVDPSNNGGDLNLDISVWDWDSEISAGLMEDYKLIIESTVLSNPAEFSDLAPVGGNDNYSTYNVDIPADNMGGTEGNEYWIIVESPNENYKNDFGITNLAGDDKLAAFFRYDLFVASEPNNQPPVAEFEVVTPMPVSGFSGVPVTFHSTSYDPDPGETATLTYYWDFDNDGTFNGPLDTFTGPPTDPVHTYTDNYNDPVSLKVQDVVGNWSNVFTCDPLDITLISCGSFVFPSSFNYYWNGGNYLCTYPCDATRAANPSKVIGCQNGASSIAAYSPTSGGCSFTLFGSYYIAGTAITTTDRVYFYDSGSTTQIYYTDYDNTLGFQNFRTAFSGGVVPGGGSLRKICVDDSDNLAALTTTGATTAKIYRYTGSGWGAGVTVPSEFWTACPSYSFITDMDYDPTVGSGGPCYLITYFNSSYHPGIFALKASDGSVLWKDTDIWPTGTFDSTMTCGVEVPMSMSSCHIICFAGKPNWSFNGTYLARYNPVGGEKASVFYQPGSFSSFYGQAALVFDNSVTPNVWRLYGNGSYSNCCISLNLPSSW